MVRSQWNDLLRESEEQATIISAPLSSLTSKPAIVSPPSPLDIDRLGNAYQQFESRQGTDSKATLQQAIVPLGFESGAITQALATDSLYSRLEELTLKPSTQDVFPTAGSTVEEYLAEVFDVAKVAATEESHRIGIKSFDSRMTALSRLRAQNMRKSFLQVLSQVAPPAQQILLPSRGRTPPLALPAPSPASGVPSQPFTALDEPVVRHARAVEELVKALPARDIVKAAAALSKAHRESYPEEDSGVSTTSMHLIWRLLQDIALEAQPSLALSANLLGGEGGPQPAAGLLSLVRGGRKHLERMYVEYMEAAVRSTAVLTPSAGSTGNLHLVNSFIQVKLGREPPLDSESAPEASNPSSIWDQVFYCMRSGFYSDALGVASSAADCASFTPLLAEWVTSGGSLSPQSSSKALSLCAPLLSAVSPNTALPPSWPFKLLCHAVLAHSHAGDLPRQLSRLSPALFPTIQDLLWFWLCHCRPADCVSSTARGARSSSALTALQTYLGKFPPNFYTGNGKDPLLYPYIMILSASLRRALHSLADVELRSPSSSFTAQAQRALPASLHAGLFLSCFGLVQSSPASPGPLVPWETPALAQDWAVHLASQGKPDWAVAYCVAGAWAAVPLPGLLEPEASAGSSSKVEEARHKAMSAGLRRLLAEGGEQAVRYLLGEDKKDPAYRAGRLRSLLPARADHSVAVQEEVLEAAEECRVRGRVREAIALYERAFQFERALSVIYDGFAAVMCQRDPARRLPPGKQADEMLSHARNLVSRIADSMGSTEPHMDALATLETALGLYSLLERGRTELLACVEQVRGAPFLPLPPRKAPACAAFLQGLPSSLLPVVPPFVHSAIELLASMDDKSDLQKTMLKEIANFVVSTKVVEWSPELVDLAVQHC